MWEQTTYLLQILQRRDIDSRLLKVEATAVDDLVDDALVNGTLRTPQPRRSQLKEEREKRDDRSNATRRIILTTSWFDMACFDRDGVAIEGEVGGERGG